MSVMLKKRFLLGSLIAACAAIALMIAWSPGSGVTSRGSFSNLPMVDHLLTQIPRRSCRFVEFFTPHAGRVCVVGHIDNAESLVQELPFLAQCENFVGADSMNSLIPKSLRLDLDDMHIFNEVDQYWIGPVASLKGKRQFSVYAAFSEPKEVFYLEYRWD